jgi:uncharacterized protein YxeA
MIFFIILSLVLFIIVIVLLAMLAVHKDRAAYYISEIRDLQEDLQLASKRWFDQCGVVSKLSNELASYKVKTLRGGSYDD